MVKPANLFVNYAVIRADIDILYKRRINTVLKVKIHIAFRKEYKCMYFLLCSRHLIIFEKQIFFLILKLYFPDYQDWSRRKLGYLIYLLFARISKKKKKSKFYTFLFWYDRIMKSEFLLSGFQLNSDVSPLLLWHTCANLSLWHSFKRALMYTVWFSSA